MKLKSKKSALLLSFTSLLLCFAMLAGSTFAWFTDTATTGVNKIVAGNLDVELLMYKEVNGRYDYVNISKEPAPIFGSETSKVAQNNNLDTLWEPSKTQVAYLAIKNEGNLDLKYQVALNVTNPADGKDLYQVMQYAIAPDAKGTDSELPAWTEGKPVTTGTQIVSGTNTTGADPAGVKLPHGETHYFALLVHMDENAGNKYQNGKVEFDLTVYATQLNSESDSFGPDYDKKAEYATPVASPAELAAALASGNDVILTQNVQMPDVIEIKDDITIYGENGAKLIVPDNADRVINVSNNEEPVTITLSNLEVEGPNTGTYTRGVSVYGNQDVTVIADNSSVSANYYALNIAGGNSKVKAVIRNTTLTGWCAFQTWSSNTNATFENCTLIGNNDKTYNADSWNDFATIVVNEGVTGVNITFKNCRIEANQTTGNKQYLFSIRAGDTVITVDNCSFYANGQELTEETMMPYINSWVGDEYTFVVK